jgi:hypothetical protein
MIAGLLVHMGIGYNNNGHMNTLRLGLS